MGKNDIPLFYWSERKFASRKSENYGDLLSKYLVEKISKRKIRFVHPKKQSWFVINKRNYLATGSILHHATKNSIVWGSGIIDIKHPVANADFRAVRGPKTREYLMKSGYECPEIYGDPAILLPKFFYPKVNKKFKLGIIPHYKDYEKAMELFGSNPDILIIDLLTCDIEKTTYEILSCENTISSSLHGLIVSHAYNIPGLWVEFSKEIFGDGVKYADYLLSLDMEVYSPEFINDSMELKNLLDLMQNTAVLPEYGKVEELQKGLLRSCPFIEVQSKTFI